MRTNEETPVLSEAQERREVFFKRRLKLKATEYCFKRACDQIVQLNRKMDSVMQRYYAARSTVNRNFRYKLRLRLAVVEGIRNMYYDYANLKASAIVSLRRELFGQIIEVVSDQERVSPMEEYDADDSEYDENADETDDEDEPTAEDAEADLSL